MRLLKRSNKVILRKQLLLFTIFLTFATTITTALIHVISNLWYKSPSLIVMPCSEEHHVYIEGQVVCENSEGVKYLSYQPSGGGWNNQRVVLENAVVLAKILNRTLIVQPLAPHQELLRNNVGDYENYNLISTDNLLPLSRVIDLKHLSKLIPVKEFTSSHKEFQNTYNHLRWARVCHNPVVGLWVDVVPKKTETEKWKLIDQKMKKSLPSYQDIPFYRRICKDEFKKFETDGFRPVWGITNDLPQKNEELVYFSEGSLRNHRLLFFDKKTVVEAHEWIMRFIHFSPEIQKRALAVLEKIQHPFNAIHVRRTDHPSSFQITQEYWLRRLNLKKAQKLTKTLYIATDEENKAWFNPFKEAGYNLFFAEDFGDQLQFKNLNSAFVQDMLGLCEQLICAHADIFVGSHYSTFSMFIERFRKQFTWQKGMLLRKPYATIGWFESS